MSRILVVDDQDAIRVTLEAMLEGMGHEAVLAGNGHEALAAQERQPSTLMLTDIFMPEMEGLETIRRMREAYPQLKIIAMSGGSPRGGGLNSLELAQKFGAARVLNKPFTREELAAALEELGVKSI